MTNKTRFVLIVLTLSLYILWISGGWKMVNGFAGSYPYAESWELQANESRVIEIITQIKQEHPELIPPGEMSSSIDRDNWCFINFYYPDTKEIAHTILSDTYPNITTISFTHLSNYEKEHSQIFDSLSIKLGIDTTNVRERTTSNSRTINKDYGYFANKRELRKFEEIILEKIKEKLK